MEYKTNNSFIFVKNDITKLKQIIPKAKFMKDLAIMPKEEVRVLIQDAVKTSLANYELSKRLESGDHLYTVNQIAKRLHKSHSTIKKLILEGYISVTKSGLISESAINEYLQKI
jgi:excisionase family DNA binding protein